MNLEKRDGKDILPLEECPYCKGELKEIDKQFCSSMDIFKECAKCGKTFKEVWVIESIEELENEGS